MPIMSLKQRLRSLFPKLYRWLWLAKKHLKERVLKDPWAHYYEDRFTEPEPWLAAIQLPTYVDTILDIGCGNGRNFIPFEGRLRLWGIDIVPERRITWTRPFQDLRYQQKTLEELTHELEKGGTDLSRTLVFTSGTMMYATRKNQQRLYRPCQASGCRNFIFHEHPETSQKHSLENFKLPPEWFDVKKMRTDDSEVLAFMHLEP